MINKIRVTILSAFLIVLSGCSGSISTSNGNGAAGNNNEQARSAANTATSVSPTAPSPQAASTPNCPSVTVPGKVFIAKQSFPFDHAPYQGSCFVTLASKEDMLDAKDVPRGSKFYIYREGKQMFEFPDAFGGTEACWVEAVSFKDLNGDNETDVAVAGSCLSAKDSYPTNAVYVNVGKGYITNEEANAKLDKFKTLKEIEDYVKKNKREFFAE